MREALCLIGLLPLLASAGASAERLGMFEGHQDVGTVLHAGSATYNSADQSYTITGSGENMWFGRDDFHFAWTKLSGDISLTADISFVGSTGDAHRKAVLMIRQSLDGDAKSVDIARHGDGLTSLQYRDATGADTHEVESNISGPKTVRIEKRGDRVYAFVSGADGTLQPAGAATKLALSGDFYVGIGVSAHDKNVTQTAIFRNVKLARLPATSGKTTLYSTLETITVASTDRRVAYVAPAHFEAPNWSRDGSFFLLNRDGHIYKFPVGGVEPGLLATDPVHGCNNDHGISPDGSMIAISSRSDTDPASSVYLAPITGGAPRRITQSSPSYWHGWSPDGKTLAFTGQRNGDFDIYIIPAAGGTETRLTTAKGLDDGPEYSPDGDYIYFNSERTGTMQIWRMKADGSGQEQVLHDETNDWFPHISPDGKLMVFVAYEKGVSGHPAEKDVTLQVMSLEDKKVRVLAKLFGGQGTMNVPSWSPDGKKLAFVSYELLPAEDAP